jgi:IS30 family transposase
MKYKHLTLEERERISLLKSHGESFREIGRKLGRHHTTISREYREYTKYLQEYIPCVAHRRAKKKEKEQREKAPLKEPEIYLYVREKLRDHWTPEEISGRIKIDLPGQSINHETIYQYIYGKGKEFKFWQYLPRSAKRRRIRTNGRRVHKSNKSHRIPGARSIEERPMKIDNRRQVGHFETDLMEGTKKDKEVLTVEVERKTRYIVLSKLPNKRSKNKSEMVQKKLKMIKSLSKTTKPLVKTITADNGLENALHKEIDMNLGTKTYFCHAYHSWEKGSVENAIGRVRRYIPKGKDLSKYTDKQIQWIENKMNNTPRKCLNYLTPNEAMEREANKYKFRSYKSTLF